MDNLHTRKIDTTGTLAIITALLLWSTGPIFIKYLTGHTGPWTQNALRYFAACLLWLPFLIFAMKKKQLDKSIWKRALLPAAANIAMQTCWVHALYYIQPGFMVLLTKSSVIWIAGFSLIFFAEERTLLKSTRFWSGMILSAIGIVGVLVNKEDFVTTKTLIGIALALTAALMGATYTIAAKILFKNLDSRTSFSVVSIYTVCTLAALAIIFGKPLDYIPEMKFYPWLVIIFSGILSIGFTHVLYYAAMKRIGAIITSLILLLQPFNILILSYIFFREKLNAWQWLFGIVLLTGSVVAIWAQQHLAPNQNAK